MRPSKIRARLRQNQPVRIACMYFPTAMMPTHAAKAGYDAIWLDSEHSGWERREIQRMLALHHLADIDCIVRTGNRVPNELYRLLEDGASSLMIPMVNSAAEARALVDATKFPPLGQRGLDGAGMDNHYYTRGIEGFTTAANAETFLLLQIETPEAVANIDEIAAVPGVDGFFMGPGDLSLRLNCPADWKDPQMSKAQSRVAAAAARRGIAWGRPTRGAEDIREMTALGGRLIAHGSDYGAVAASLPQFAKAIAEGLA